MKTLENDIETAYRVFLKILTHLFSVFEVLNVCQGTYSVHETKEGSLEICLTACMLSFIGSYNRTKEKRRHCNFTFSPNPAY